MTLESHIAKSLSDAGIGKIYHERSLIDFDKQGVQLSDWLKAGGGTAMKSGGCLILRDFDRAPVTMLARALHINGVGVRCLPLTAIWGTLQKPGSEKWDDLLDADAIFVMPAQSSRDNPLSYWQRDVVEAFLLERAENMKSVVLHMTETTKSEPWWTDEFMGTIRACGQALRAGDTK